MGGEIYPEYQRSLFTDAYALDIDHQDPWVAIETTHMSYLLNYQAFNMDGVGYTGEQRIRAERASNMMGYEFTISQVRVEASTLQADRVDARVSIELKNSGVAPFYYPLSITLTSRSTGESWALELTPEVIRPSDGMTELTF